MARIRTTKPEFWSSEQVMACSRDARLLFIGLWNFADDAGRMRNSEKTIKAQVLPGDDVSSADVRRWLDELSANHLLLIYEAGGLSYIQITGWHHQKIDRPRKSKLPSPPRSLDDNSTSDRRDLATDPTLSYPTLQDRMGVEGAHAIEFDWKPKKETLDSAKASHGLTDADLDSMAKRFLPYYRARTNEIRTDWDEQFLSWCVLEAKKLGRSARSSRTEPENPLQPEFAVVATHLRTLVSSDEFAVWFKGATIELSPKGVSLHAPSGFCRAHWMSQFEHKIITALKAAYPDAPKVEIAPFKAGKAA